MRVVLVRNGTKYGPEYVSAMIDQIGEHSDAEVVTLTDQDDTPGRTLPLEQGWPIWWAKLELFAPYHERIRPFVFMDIDSFVLAPFSHLFVERFTMVKDFNNWGRGNSSVMYVPEDVQFIWDDFYDNPEHHMRVAGGHGDQGYLSTHCKHFFDHEDDGVVSYKVHGKEGPVGCVMQFHGRPNPVDAGGWAEERWHQYAGNRS